MFWALILSTLRFQSGWGASGEGLLQGWVFGVQGSGFHSPSGDTEGVTTAPGLCCFLGHYFVHFSGIHRDLF